MLHSCKRFVRPTSKNRHKWTSAMGNTIRLIMGKPTVETRKFEVVLQCDEYEIRKYLPCIVAETTYEGNMERGDAGFKTLARFIGAGIYTPANVKSGQSESIAMTAPVITQNENIAMTAPVITKAEPIAMTAPVMTTPEGGEANPTGRVKMCFVMPSQYTMETLPKPTDPNVEIKELPEMFAAVRTFSGWASPADIDREKGILELALGKNNVKVLGAMEFCRYNPPWTPGPLRTNEVLYPVEYSV
eukprot:Colp12_sorted_trinity150504_noHs@11319